VLRVSDIIHKKEGTVNQDVNPENYFIEDRIEYFVTIDQKVKGEWVSYVADDIQLAFVMLDPYIRTPLKSVSAGTYTTKFRTPQRLGIFKFSVDYMRHGLSYLNLDDEVSVIQWRHDAFPRFMHRAAPFYVSMFVLMAGFFVLVITFLFGGDRAANQVKKV
jgi:oligosaccharyltransferase complex subunit beta